MKFKKTLLATLPIVFAGAAFAQGTQTIPVPASSVDRGGRAVRGFTIPVVPTTQQVTDIALQAITANPVAPRAWSSYFILNPAVTPPSQAARNGSMAAKGG